VIGDPCCRDLVPLKPAQERVPAGWEREVPLTGCETLLAMSGAAGPSREQARRALTEREQTFKDREEDFVHAKAAAATKEERRALSQDFGEYRRRHREENVAAGRRAADGGIRMHQIMWARWAEVAVEHELDARGAFAAIVANPEEGSLLKDFRASLVAITGAAYAIEAVYGDIKYLIPEQPRRDSRELNLWHAFNQAFGIPASASHRLLPDIRWLFALRDHAAHPYTRTPRQNRRRNIRRESTRAPRFGKTYAGEPDQLVKELAEDEAIAASDTLLLTVPNQLGVDYNAHVLESVLRHLEGMPPKRGWRHTALKSARLRCRRS
jgi:hypothetical protein